MIIERRISSPIKGGTIAITTKNTNSRIKTNLEEIEEKGK